MPRQRVVIVGAGGHGRELFSYVEDLVRQGWDGEFVGYLDDAAESAGGAVEERVLGRLNRFVGCPDDFFIGLHYVTAVGNNATRRAIVGRIEAAYGRRLPAWTLAHGSAHVGHDVEIGEGSCLAPGSIVTRSVRIGRHCILNVKASVSHDCILGDYVNVNPGATICGNVTVGEGAYIGAGATIKDKVSIGAWSVVGAGATVVRNVPPRVTVVGVPARVITEHAVRS